MTRQRRNDARCILTFSHCRCKIFFERAFIYDFLRTYLPTCRKPGMIPDSYEATPAKRTDRRTALLLGLILAASLLIRMVRLDQPIVENYVGRQIPTAMVARNLERGSGFFRPQLDTGPFPNYFLVEPPVYEQIVVWLNRLVGLGLEPSGRLVAALGMTMAAWGLYQLVERREGKNTALLAALAFSAFPVTIRYGRAFQPDALMLGGAILGLSCWDRTGNGNASLQWRLGVAGWIFLASGIAMKVTSAYMLFPFVACFPSPLLRTRIAVAATVLLPALAWYLWANHVVNSGGGSLASVGNRAIWLHVLIPTALFSVPTWGFIGRFVVWRCFTPIGPVLAAIGTFGQSSRGSDQKSIWWIWGASAAVALAVLAAKLHHEYYFLAIAPILAVGVGRGVILLNERSRTAGWLASAVFLGLCGFQARPTWSTPHEWTHLFEAAKVVAVRVPADAWVVAPEALLFQADRRGCRLEFSESGCRRAAEEWGESRAIVDPAELVELYRARGARFFADLGTARGSAAAKLGETRVALHEAIRQRYKVIVDQPAVLLAELCDSRCPDEE